MEKVRINKIYEKSDFTNAIKNDDLSAVVSTPVPKSEQDIWTLENEYGEKMKNAENSQDKSYYERMRLILKSAANYSSLSFKHIENGKMRFNIKFSDEYILNDFLNYMNTISINAVKNDDLSAIVSTPVPKSEQDIWTLENEYGEKMKNAENSQDKSYYERMRLILKGAANYSSLSSQHIEDGKMRFNIKFSDEHILNDFLSYVNNTDWERVGQTFNNKR